MFSFETGCLNSAKTSPPKLDSSNFPSEFAVWDRWDAQGHKSSKGPVSHNVTVHTVHAWWKSGQFSEKPRQCDFVWFSDLLIFALKHIIEAPFNHHSTSIQPANHQGLGLGAREPGAQRAARSGRPKWVITIKVCTYGLSMVYGRYAELVNL